MKGTVVCDFNGCQLRASKVLGTKGVSWLSGYEDEIDLCQKHYIEVLEWFYSKSTGQHISELLAKERGSP